jgi:hypothetical protein
MGGTMNYGKQGLKVLGLSLLAALGLMAFGVSGASASGSFLIEGLGAPWEATITGAGENLLESRFIVLPLNIEIFCHLATATGTIKNTGHGHATLTFSECLTVGIDSNVVHTLKGSVCTLEENIIAKVLALVFLHTNGAPYILLSPLDGLTFAEVGGEPCIPGAKIKGSQVLSISNSGGDDVTKLISTKIANYSTLFPSDSLKYGINAATLTADANVSLSGAHVGRKWGAV